MQSKKGGQGLHSCVHKAIDYLIFMLKELKFRELAPKVASREDVVELQAKLGVTFPPAFFEFCTRWNGGLPSEENSFYPVPKSFIEFFEEYGPEEGGVVVHQMLGATEDFQACSLSRKYNVLNESTNLGLIPVTSDLLGNQVLLRADNPGGVVYWRDQDLWELPENPRLGPQVGGRPRLFPIAPSLEYFYNALTADPKAED